MPAATISGVLVGVGENGLTVFLTLLPLSAVRLAPVTLIDEPLAAHDGRLR